MPGAIEEHARRAFAASHWKLAQRLLVLGPMWAEQAATPDHATVGEIQLLTMGQASGKCLRKLRAPQLLKVRYETGTGHVSPRAADGVPPIPRHDCERRHYQRQRLPDTPQRFGQY